MLEDIHTVRYVRDWCVILGMESLLMWVWSTDHTITAVLVILLLYLSCRRHCYICHFTDFYSLVSWLLLIVTRTYTHKGRFLIFNLSKLLKLLFFSLHFPSFWWVFKCCDITTNLLSWLLHISLSQWHKVVL